MKVTLDRAKCLGFYDRVNPDVNNPFKMDLQTPLDSGLHLSSV